MMEAGSWTWAIVTGAASGIVSYAIIQALVWQFKRVVLPWYQSLTYKGIDIAGEWQLHSSSTAQTGVLRLEQQASRLTGRCTLVAKDPEGSHGQFEMARTFLVEGRIQDLLVILNLAHSERRRLGSGVLVLEVVSDGRRMVGQHAFLSVVTRAVQTSQVQATREGAQPQDPVRQEYNRIPWMVSEEYPDYEVSDGDEAVEDEASEP